MYMYMYIYKTYFIDDCVITLRSWGFDDPDKTGYIKLNNITIATTAFGDRGFRVATVNPCTCTVAQTAMFNIFTSAAEANSMVAYLNLQSGGAIVIGAVADTATGNNGIVAPTLNANYGVEVGDMRFREKMVFVAMKGNPGVRKAERDPSPPDPLVVVYKIGEFTNCGNVSLFDQ